MQYEALPNESGGIFLNIGRQDGFVPFQIHSVTLRGPVPEAAMHAPAMTTPPPCFTNEAVCLGSFIHTHRKLLITHLSMFLYRSHVSITPAQLKPPQIYLHTKTI